MTLPATNPWTDSDVEQHWDDVAGIYVKANDRVAETHSQRFRMAMQWLKLTPGCRVLNISSRDCEADDYIRATCSTAHVLHAEISQGLIDVARRLRPDAQQEKIANYSQLPFQNAAFDRILTLETLEHVAEPIRFLEELHRVSTPDAVMVLSCPPATAELPYRLYTKFCGGHGEGPHRFLPSREVIAALNGTGWTLDRHAGTLLVPVGPRPLRRLGEWVIDHLQGTLVAELGIRQFYVCHKP